MVWGNGVHLQDVRAKALAGRAGAARGLNSMKNTVAVMNTKGGVGKSTLVLAIAETLSVKHKKNVLVIDSDAQASVSSMLMTIAHLHGLQQNGKTVVDFLVNQVLQNKSTPWSEFVVRNISDVDEADTVYLLPSDMQLTLLEREVSKESLHARLRAVIAELLSAVRDVFDVVLVDCPPGLSILTESWLREADFYLSPTKADYVSVCGLEVFRRFKGLNPEMGFAENLGVVVNMMDGTSRTERDYHVWLAENAENRCFDWAIPRRSALQDAGRYDSLQRSYAAKYPGEVGQAVLGLSEQVLQRMNEFSASAQPESAASGNSGGGIDETSSMDGNNEQVREAQIVGVQSTSAIQQPPPLNATSAA